MDEIRCPMCGKLNPPELENCQYCQARLKPLIVSQPPEEQEDAPLSSAQEESLPDWLKDLRSQDNQLPNRIESDFGGEPSGGETGEDDWLKQLRDQSLTEDEEQVVEDDDSAPFTNDALGLERIEQDESAIQPEDILFEESEEETTWHPTARPSDKDEIPDWMSEIRSEDTSPDLGEEEIELPEVEVDSLEDEQLPDWLSGLGSTEEEIPAWLPDAETESGSTAAFEASEEEMSEEGQESPGESDEEELPEEGQEIPEEPSEEVVQDEEPVWLKELKAGQAEDVLSPTKEGEKEEEGIELEKAELPDWLANLQTDQGVEEAEVEELPAWLTTSEQEITSETGEAELPDWLSPLEDQEGKESALPEETPEWLGDLETREVEESLEVPLEEAVEQPEPEEQPQWMADLEKEYSPELAEEGESQFVLAEEGVEEAEESIGLPQEEIVEEPEQEEVPQWMADFEKEFSPEIAEEGVSPFAFAEEGVEEAEESFGFLEEEIVEEPGQEETPGWLAELEKEFSPESTEESVPAFITEEEEGESAVSESPPLVVEEDVDFMETIPEWAAEVPLEEGASEEEGEPPIEEAELPSWLEAMRPVESVPLEIVEEEEPAGQVETSGPLAGLSGVLMAESDFARVRKPPAYSVKLRVTENQEARVALLRELLTAEDKQKVLPSKPVITSQYIFRLVIAVALILPIAWAVISGDSLTPLPNPLNVPAGVMDMHSQIDQQLSANSPVLVAFDYEPGFSGELDLPTKAVISHMMDKGAFLTLVSTSTSGPIMAERLIDSLNQTPTRQENPYTGYANMGYIPGGTAGLLSLAQSPQQTAPYTLDNVVVWESAPLNLINNIADFSMVLVITENTENARAWIEQVQPYLKVNNTPLVMVVSAQAEPLVVPYYQSSPNQVKALVVGFPGGVAYDSLDGQGALARGSWDAFSLSMLITEIILVIGAVVGLGSMLFVTNKKEKD